MVVKLCSTRTKEEGMKNVRMIRDVKSGVSISH